MMPIWVLGKYLIYDLKIGEQIMKKLLTGFMLLVSASVFAAKECRTFVLGAYKAKEICGEVSYLRSGDLKVSNIFFGQDRIKSNRYSRNLICKLFLNSNAEYRLFSKEIKKTTRNLDLETGERSLIHSHSNIVPYLHSLACN